MSEKDDVFEVKLVNDEKLAMSNILISSKYKASLTELKVTYLALQQVQMHKFEREYGDQGHMIVKISGRELQKQFDVKGNSFFERLATAAEHMTGRSIGIVDPVAKRFEFVSFMDKVKYENGELTIRFVPEMEKLILNIDKNFTYLLKDTMMNFEREYSFKLYEVLKSYSFYPKDYKKPKSGKFSITIGLAELKLTMGVVNSELDAVKSVLNKTKDNPDYEAAVAKSPEKVYNDWYEFRRQVLEPSVKEINEKTDINIEYEPVKSGRGGKVKEVKFLIQDTKYETDNSPAVKLDKKNWDVTPELDQTEKFAMWTKVISMITDIVNDGENTELITPAMEICDAGNYDIEYITEKIKLLKRQKNKIENPIGWVISACKENYTTMEANTVQSQGERFMEREIDYTELEEQLLKNS